MDERLLKPAKVAEILQLSIGHTYALMKRGEIPTIRIGTTVRVRREDLDQYIKNKSAGQSTVSNESENAPGASH